jgi:inhibitor of KinA sporulation pathway (predicted exonuclease)
MNPIRDINYFSLDLELNNLNNGIVPKIIQVGIAIGSPLRPDDIKTFSWYLDPEEKITDFIKNLTGITDEIIKEKAVSHETVAKELGELLSVNECFVNPVVWGGGGDGNDASELKDEFRERNIHFPFFGRRVIDVKGIYVFLEQVNGRSPSGGLRKSLSRYGLKFQGTPHNAEYDALNTLRFYFDLIQRQRKLEDTVNLMKSIEY